MTDRQAGTGLSEWRTTWVLPVVSAIGYAAAVTHMYSLGLFIEPLERDLGWSRSQIAMGLTINSGVGVVLGTFVGILVDRWGPRRLALPGMVLFCGMLAALSLAGPGIGSWYALWVFMGIAGASVQPVVWTAAITATFDRTRGLALAVAMSGGGLCTALAPLVANAYIVQLGWRGAYVALAVTLAVIALPLVFLAFRIRPTARARPPVQVERANLREALLSRPFISLTLISLVMTASMMALVVHFVPLLTSLRLDRAVAASAAGAIGVSSIVGRLVGGVLLDRFNGPTIAAVIFALPILAVGLLLGPDVGTATAVAAAVLIGLAVGGEVDVLAYMTSRYFHLAHFGRLFAIVSVSGLIGVGIGPLLGGAIFDMSASYRGLLLTILPVCGVASVLVIMLGPYTKSR